MKIPEPGSKTDRIVQIVSFLAGLITSAIIIKVFKGWS